MNEPWLADDTAGAYAAAMVDADGCVGVYRWRSRDDKHWVNSRVITVSVTNLPMLDAYARCLDRVGVPYRRSGPTKNTGNRQDTYQVVVTSRLGFEAFARGVSLQHPDKARKLLQGLASFKPPNCAACGIGLDDRTPGCKGCIYRHKMRRRSLANGAGTKVPAVGKPGRPRRVA